MALSHSSQLRLRQNHPRLCSALSPRRLTLAVAAALSGIALAGAAQAQSTPTAAAPPAPTQKVDKVEVTGSNIKRIDAESASPIQVITAEEIRRSGRQSVTELLRELPINAAGGLTELSGSSSFSAGAASASLRGLGSAATLVLLNGRRVAPYGLSDPNAGQSAVVNLNAIPIEVIERIEILKDGASAIYGSEAIAGVINIILRKDYVGNQAGFSTTANEDGLYKNSSVTATLGRGDLAKDRYNAFVNVEFYRQDSTLFKDVLPFLNRQQFVDVYGTGQLSSAFSPFITYITNAAGAAVASPGAACPAANIVPWNFNGFNLPGVAGGSSGNVCLYDNLSRSEIVPKSERKSVFARGTVDVSANTQIYLETAFTQSKTYFLGFPQTVGFGLGPTFNSLSGRINPAPTTLVQGHPNNPFARNTIIRARMDAVGPADNEVNNETLRVVAGIKSTIGRFDVESGVLYNRNEVKTINWNSLRYDRLVQGFGFSVVPNAVGNPTLVANLAGGTFNWANPNGGSVTADSIRINARDKAESQFTTWDAKLSGEAFKLPGGMAGVAAGLEFRREERLVTPDAEKVRGNVFGRGVSVADGSRNVSTVFGELVMPILPSVEVQTAVRYDRYSDYGSSVTPKVAASWNVLPGVKLRGSYASGFRAPALTEITRSATSGFFNGVDDPRRCFRPTITTGCAVSIAGLISGFAQIKPEKAATYTSGLVWEPSADSNVSVDYFAISRRNEITFIGINDMLLNEGSSDPRYANRVFRDTANVNPAISNDPGAILYVLIGFDNLGETRVKGFDIDARHRRSLGEYGRMTLSAIATFYTDQRSSPTPGARLISYSGYRNAPELRAQFRATWEYRDWTSNAAVNYLHSTKSHINPDPENAAASTRAQIADCGNAAGTYLGVCSIAPYITIDAGTEYRGFKNWRLNFLVRNLANQRPPMDPLARPFNFAWYQPQGMNFVASARYTFK